ncbi:hypothetical protein GSI_07553 [Ganoderma sinense ZZ0214-1]|uniref:Uncharacterized protein n=1 Tax=Ganoderma sinense ZZ0214-1 TaxID=1077348 RepID=A0A2G8S9U9_9APHY|nr:hypothetical protein GSI_07553 [Ganoderma sinense ZZ0214-1]
MYGMNSSDVVVFTQSMSAILLHRFLLHLQTSRTYASMEFGDAETSRGSTLALDELCESPKVT